MLKFKLNKYPKVWYLTLLTLVLSFTIIGQGNMKNLSENQKMNSFLKIGNEEIRYLQKGKGEDILLIHGSPGSIEDWKEIIDSLAQNYRVTAFDRMGHGYSSKKHYKYTLKDNAVLTEQIIEKLDLKSPLVVGHSYGGCIATFMAINSKLAGLQFIILDSPFYEFKPNGINKMISIPILGKSIAFLSSFTIAKSQIKKRVSPMFKSTDGEKLEHYINERQELWSQTKVIYSNAKEIKNLKQGLKSLSEEYKNTEAIFTLITVEDSVNTFRNGTEKIHKELKNSEIFIIPNTGHYIQLEQPQQIIRIIKSKRNKMSHNQL